MRITLLHRSLLAVAQGPSQNMVKRSWINTGICVEFFQPFYSWNPSTTPLFIPDLADNKLRFHCSHLWNYKKRFFLSVKMTIGLCMCLLVESTPSTLNYITLTSWNSWIDGVIFRLKISLIIYWVYNLYHAFPDVHKMLLLLCQVRWFQTRAHN